VAVVEDIKGNPPQLQVMDYVVPGQVIRLGARDTIVLGYMDSCARETITGGTVTIGQDLSEVESGTVERSQPPCAGGQADLTRQQANQSAAMAFRDLAQGRSAMGPQVTIYSTYPIVEARGGGALTVTRIDREGETIEVSLSEGRLARGLFYDFLAAHKTLSAGGTYRATLNGRSIVFRIDDHAAPNRTATISRLLRFGAASH
jgi:hypothetical protein